MLLKAKALRSKQGGKIIIVFPIPGSEFEVPDHDLVDVVISEELKFNNPKHDRMIVVNLYGGPGSGKSTTAAGVFYELKQQGINCELITEYAKDKVWEGAFTTLDDQLYVFGKQHHRVFTKIGKTDVVITDSPLLLSLVYGKNLRESFKQLVRETHGDFDSMDFFLVRHKPYHEAGRMQKEAKAIELDEKILTMLVENGVSFEKIVGDKTAPTEIANRIIKKMQDGRS